MFEDDEDNDGRLGEMMMNVGAVVDGVKAALMKRIGSPRGRRGWEALQEVDVVCEVCEGTGVSGTRVHEMGSYVTWAGDERAWVAADGKEHCHGGNKIVVQLTCREGHRWEQAFLMGRCWCGWRASEV